jgi:hypothetical protein
MSTGSFPGVESNRGMTLTPHQILVPRSKTVGLYLYSLRAYVAFKKGETYHYFKYSAQSFRYILHIEEFLTILLHAGNENFKHVFYSIVSFLIIGQ